MEKVLRKSVLPESVSVAKYRCDTEELRRLGRLGATKKAQLKQGRLQMAAQKKAVPAALADTQVSLADEVMAEEYARITYADAHAHAMRNLAGWAD